MNKNKEKIRKFEFDGYLIELTHILNNNSGYCLPNILGKDCIGFLTEQHEFVYRYNQDKIPAKSVEKLSKWKIIMEEIIDEQ